MAKVKASGSNGDHKKKRPALTPEARENQMISYAFDLVEQRLLDGTASSQETTHFLKLATQKAQLEKEKLAAENKLIIAKAEKIESDQRSEEMYKNALEAMKRYSGHSSEESDEYDEYDEY